MKPLQWMMSIGVACTTLAACQKSSEMEKREAERAAAEADKKQAEAKNETDKKRGDLHEAVVKEKADYHSKIQRAVADLEKDLADHKIDVTQIHRGDRTKDRTMYGAVPAKDFDAIESMLIRRDRLLDYNDKIDATNDNDWPAQKQAIDRELDTKGRLRPGRI